MVDRIILSPNGIRISKKGFDANVAADENMAMFSGMDPMRPVYNDTATFSGSGTQSFSITNPNELQPIVILRSDDGWCADRGTYCAETAPPFNGVTIHNVDGLARTVTFFVMI